MGYIWRLFKLHTTDIPAGEIVETSRIFKTRAGAIANVKRELPKIYPNIYRSKRYSVQIVNIDDPDHIFRFVINRGETQMMTAHYKEQDAKLQQLHPYLLTRVLRDDSVEIYKKDEGKMIISKDGSVCKLGFWYG